jgi:hypothetical protein
MDKVMKHTKFIIENIIPEIVRESHQQLWFYNIAINEVDTA